MLLVGGAFDSIVFFTWMMPVRTQLTRDFLLGCVGTDSKDRWFVFYTRVNKMLLNSLGVGEGSAQVDKNVQLGHFCLHFGVQRGMQRLTAPIYSRFFPCREYQLNCSSASQHAGAPGLGSGQGLLA